MPGTRKAPAKKGTKPAAKKATATKRGAPKGPREPIVTPDRATFDTDDKRAQYARLVVFNFAKSKNSKAKVKPSDDVNSVSNAVLSMAGKELVGGNMIKGKDGLDLIISLTKEGAEDEKVAKRGLTPAYAAEVRPFLRRLKLAPSFGRRGKKVAEDKNGKVSSDTAASEESAESVEEGELVESAA